jgi:hypothetical protein
MTNEPWMLAQLIVEQFPEYAQTVLNLLVENEGFQALCTDYIEARRALAIWGARADRASELARDYRLLACALEADILEVLSDLETEG